VGLGQVNPMKFVFILVLLLLVVPLGYVSVCRAASESDARAAVSGAQQRINTCYKAAADAVKAVADVSGLVSVLNDAGSFVSRAQLALGQGDFDSASTLAHLCEERLVGFEDGAVDLKSSAVQAGFLDFVFNVVGSAVGSVVVVLVGFVVWYFLRKRYPGVF
jgi:hypothetical protein